MSDFFLSNCVGLCGFVLAYEGVDVDARKFNTRSVVLNFFLEHPMPSLDEIRAEKIQVRMEKVALDAQIAKALKASDLLDAQLRQLKMERAAAQVGQSASTSMDAYMMSSRSFSSEDALRLQNRERSKVAAIARWLTGRE
jgi:hypothetical protein